MEPNMKPMTVKEILKDISAMLGDINVPVAQIESIGIPIARAISGITVCIEAFDKGEEEKAKQEEPEIVPAEESAGNA